MNMSVVSSSTLLSVLLHVGILCTYWYSIYFDYKYLEDTHPLWQTYGGRWKFLTWWNLWFQTIFFGLCLLNDLFGSNSNTQVESPLQKLRNVFLASVAWPMGSFVQITFWVLYWIDRELVFPKFLDEVVPSWHNHIYHTLLLPFLLLQMFFFRHVFPRKSTGVKINLVVGIIYILWTLFIAVRADLWVYPVLEVLNWPLRVFFYSVLLLFFIGLYFAGEKLNKTIWGSHTTKYE